MVFIRILSGGGIRFGRILLSAVILFHSVAGSVSALPSTRRSSAHCLPFHRAALVAPVQHVLHAFSLKGRFEEFNMVRRWRRTLLARQIYFQGGGPWLWRNI